MSQSIQLSYLKEFKGKTGLYIIYARDESLLKSICTKLNYAIPNTNIAYIGKTEKCLYSRGKQEMGWANFKAATFVNKIAQYLDIDTTIKDKAITKENVYRTRKYILEHFYIECLEVAESHPNIQEWETEMIRESKPGLNKRKVKI